MSDHTDPIAAAAAKNPALWSESEQAWDKWADRQFVLHGALASQIGEKRVEYHPPFGYHEAVLGVARSLIEGERSVLSAEGIVGLAQEIVDRVLALDAPSVSVTQEPTS